MGRAGAWHALFLSLKWQQWDVYDLISVEPDFFLLWWFQICVCVFSSKLGRSFALIHIFLELVRCFNHLQSCFISSSVDQAVHTGKMRNFNGVFQRYGFEKHCCHYHDYLLYARSTYMIFGKVSVCCLCDMNSWRLMGAWQDAWGIDADIFLIFFPQNLRTFENVVYVQTTSHFRMSEEFSEIIFF